MNFQEAIKILDIEDYGERIFNSNSHGELFHLVDYIELAKSPIKLDWFREWFISIVTQAEKSWSRPDSVFQYITQILSDNIIIQEK